MKKKIRKKDKGQSVETPKYPAEFLADLEYVVDKLGRKFSFGIYGREDIEQEARLLGLGAYEKYNAEKGELRKFLYIFIQSRLINMMRNNMRRNDPPCKTCHEAADGYTEHADGRFCNKYRAWKERNDLKCNLFKPGSLEGLNYDDSYEASFYGDELIKKIDENISPQNRKYFLKIIAGVSVSKYRKEALEEEIRFILGGERLDEVINGKTE